MHARTLAAIVLYLVAIGAPVTGLYAVYGPSVAVNASSPHDLVALTASTTVAFVVALGASRVSQSTSSSLQGVLREIVKGFEPASRREASTSNRSVSSSRRASSSRRLRS